MSEGAVCGLIVYAAFPAILILAIVVKLREMRAARHWPSTAGTVVASGVRAHKKTPGDPGYNTGDTEVVNNPRVEYEYVVGGRTYRGGQITLGEQPSHLELEAILARFPVGAAVTVYYDPANPQTAVLERDLPWWAIKAIGCLLLLLLGGPPLVWLLGPPMFHNAVAWLKPHLVNPGSAEWVTALIGIGLLVALFAFGCTAYVWRVGRWPVTRGRIVASGVEAFEFSGDSSSSTRYKPAVLYTYAVNGRQYSGDRVTYGLIGSGYSQSSAARIAAKYPVGSEVTVYYNPKNSGDSMVNPHSRWHYTPWLIAAGIFTAAWALATGRLG